MIKRGLTLCALLFWAGLATAGEVPLYQPAPDWVKPAPPVDVSKIDDQAPVIMVLDYQTRFRDQTNWEYTETATRVASAQMLDQVGNIQISWNPDLGDLVIHSLEIVRTGETVDLLAQGQKFEILRREQGLEQRQINGILTASMTVKGLRIGDVLRMRASTNERDPLLDGKLQSVRGLVAEPAKVGFGRVRLLWPKDEAIHWRVLAGGVDAKPVIKGDTAELEFSMPLAKPEDLPNDAPIRFQKPPLFEATDFDSWQSISATMSPLFSTEGTIAPGSPLAREVDKIAKAETDPLRRTALALRLVQDQVSYLFNGLNGGNYRPQTPAQTWETRYGDCKAKTLLLLAILHQLGVEAEPVLANLSRGDAVVNSLPIPAAFDHVLVHATIAGTDYWLDGTGRGTRLIDLSDTPPFLHVLPLRPVGSGLIDLPYRPTTRPDYSADITYDDSAGLSLPTLVSAKILLRGAVAEQLSIGLGQTNDKQKRELLQKLSTPVVGDDFLLNEYKLNYDPVEAILTIDLNGLVSTKWSREDERYNYDADATIDALDISADRARTAWKDIPVLAGPPTRQRITRSVILPDHGKGFTVEGATTLPATLMGLQMKRTTEFADGKLVVTDTSAVIVPEVAASELPAQRAELARAKANPLRLTAPADYPALSGIVANARRQGQIAQMLAVYDASIKREPDEEWLYANRASFQAEVYDYAAALKDYDKVIELAPDADAYAQRRVYRLMLNDDVGALADAKAAYDLDSGAIQQVIALAEAYAWNGRKDEGLVLLDERIMIGGKDKADYLLAKAAILSDLGEKDAALATIALASRAGPASADRLNQQCWVKGRLSASLETALKDCTKSIELADSPASPLDSRAMVYFRLERFDDALADLEAALAISPDEAPSLFMRGVIEQRQGAKAVAQADLARARLISPRIDEYYARYGIKP